MNQEGLLEQLKAQDSKAIAQMYDMYGGALFGVIMRIVQSKELAEHVLQDTFVKAWRNGSSYDPSKGRLFTWLINIARNTAIDVTRSAQYKNYQKSVSTDVLLQKSSSEGITPEHIGLKDITSRLDEKYRVLIDLIYFQGYTQEEVAEKTGVPIGTIKTRLRYAILELRKYFGENPKSVAVLVSFLEKIVNNNSWS